MKRFIRFIALVTVLTVLGGSIGMAENLASVEEVLEKAGCTLEDVQDVARLERFISEGELDRYILEYIPGDILKKYIQLLNEGAPLAYESLIIEEDLPAGDETAPGNTIRQILVYRQSDASASSLAIDFSVGRAYISPYQNMLNDVVYADSWVELREEDYGEISRMVEEANLEKGDHRELGTNEYVYALALVVVYDDAVTRYFFRGAGLEIPQNVIGLTNDLFNMIYNKAN